MSDLNKPQLIGGIDSAGNLVPVKVAADGSLGSSGGSGGSGGDASAINQQAEIAKLTSIESKVATTSKQDEQTTALNNLLGTKIDQADITSVNGSGLQGWLSSIQYNLTAYIKGNLSTLNGTFGQSTDGLAEGTDDVTLMSLIKAIFLNTDQTNNKYTDYYQLENSSNAYVNINLKDYKNNLVITFDDLYNQPNPYLDCAFYNSTGIYIGIPLVYKLGDSEAQEAYFTNFLIDKKAAYVLRLLGNFNDEYTLRISWHNGINNVTPLTFYVNPYYADSATRVLEKIGNNIGKDITGTTIPTGGSGIRGLLSWIAKLISDRIPSSLGTQTSAQSFPVTLSSDGAFSTNFGVTTDIAATSDTGTFSFLAFVKRLLSVKLDVSLSTINNKVATLVNGRTPVNSVGASLELSGTASAFQASVIAATDVSDYSWITFQLTGTWNANIQVQFSDDNINWIQAYFHNVTTNVVNNLISSINGLFYTPKQGKYFRLYVVTYISGTIVGTAQASNNASAIIPIQTVAFNGSQPISAASLPLPSLASTSTLQTTGNTTLSSIDTKTPTLGQALSAASVPVVLPAAQITALTPLSTITANLGTIGAVATESSLSALNNKLPSSTIGDRLKVDGSGVTQPISGIVSLSSNIVDTELPAAVTLADNISLSASPSIISPQYCYNGPNWDRVRGASSSGQGQGRSLMAPGTTTVTLLNSVTSTSTGSAQNLGSSYEKITAQLIINSGTVSTISCSIEGSFNGTKWFNLAILTDATDGAQVSSTGKCFTQIRANLTTLTGTSPNISILCGAVT